MKDRLLPTNVGTFMFWLCSVVNYVLALTGRLGGRQGKYDFSIYMQITCD